MAAKHTAIVVAVTAALVGALVGANAMMQRSRKPSASSASASTGPITYTEFDEPIKAITFVNGQKGPKRDRALAMVVGKHVPAPGWDATITAITSESGGRIALRMQYFSASVIGGEYWVVAIVGKNHGLKEGDPVKVSGRIKDVLMNTGPASVIQTVILEDA